MTALLSIRDLTITYRSGTLDLEAVRHVNLTLEAGQTLSIVGESGCGKSTLALSLMGLLPERESRIPTGEMLFNGRNLLLNSARAWQQLRGREIAMVFQDPFSALNPVLTVNRQIQEPLELDGIRPDQGRAAALLERVQLKDPNRILASYPHQLSGGQRQRAMIAMALARHPKLLIADEPTTALDVTVQDEIMNLLKSLRQERQMSMIFITHNLGLAKSISDSMAVMYAGEIVEYGETADVLRSPKHPYTVGLMASQPRIETRGPLPSLDGQPPHPADRPSGCPFHPRCAKKFSPCEIEDPGERVSDHIRVRCHLYT